MVASRSRPPLVGGVEAGGTKMVCAVGTGPEDVRDEHRFPTTDPGAAIEALVGYFRDRERTHGRIAALGIASFGPVEADPASASWGRITSTPKPGWANVDLAGPLRGALDVAVGFDTDVNGAALGEWRWGAGRGLRSVVYVTVGTGIGGGAVLDGEPLRGLMHPEMGHVIVRRDPSRDPFGGRCPYHGDCLEGLASGPALAARWGRPAEELPDGHPAWDLEADYLAQGLVSIILVLSPQRIVLGGGVTRNPSLLPKVRGAVRERLGGYLPRRELNEHLDGYIVPPGLGERSGLLGAFALAMRALDPTAHPSAAVPPASR